MNYRGLVLRQGNCVYSCKEDTLTRAVHNCNSQANNGDYIRIVEVYDALDTEDSGQAVMFYRFTPDLVFK